MKLDIKIICILILGFGCSHSPISSNNSSKNCYQLSEVRGPNSAALCNDLFLKNESEKDKVDKDKLSLNPHSPKPFYFQLKFNKILPGQFEMLNQTGENPIIKITRPFEMAQTETTQLQWSVVKVLLGEKNPNKINPSKFKSDQDSIKIQINDIEVEMKPDHPVEQVSYEDVIDWIQGLNKLSVSTDEKIQEQLLKVIPSHQKGNIYDLPTEAQWAFVAQNRGKNNKIYFDTNSSDTLAIYAWYSQASGYSEPGGMQSSMNKTFNLLGTQRVATKQPRLIDTGNGDLVPFFGLQGNVGEWTKDWFGLKLVDGDDPQGPSAGNWRVVRGGAYTNLAKDLRLDYRSTEGPLERLRSVGFRLIRLVP